MRAVTKVAIREARLKEIKTELLNSQKLQVSRTHSWDNFKNKVRPHITSLFIYSRGTPCMRRAMDSEDRLCIEKVYI